MSIQINPGLVTPVLPLLEEKIEPQAVIKNEPPESEIVEIGVDDILNSSDEEIIPNGKIIDSVLQFKEQFAKRANITPSDNLNKAEVTSDGNANKDTGQGVTEVEDNLNTHEQLVNSSDDLDGTSIKSRKPEHHKKTGGKTSWNKEKEKIIPLEPNEYTSLAKNKHICNHCQYACEILQDLKIHIMDVHREITTMYQCPHCPFKSKRSLRCHIIQKHKDTKDNQWFQHRCEKCEFVCETFAEFKVHEYSHKKKAKMDNWDLKYHCDKCSYKTYRHDALKSHKLNHLKPEEIQYFYCYNCSYKSNRKDILKRHILAHFRNEEIKFHCYICDFMTLKRELIIGHIMTHSTEKYERRYSCEKCASVSGTYEEFKLHELSHKSKAKMNNRDLKYHCDKCNYKTYRLYTLKRHKFVHLKPEINQYYYCYHCSYKSNRKDDIKRHVSGHYRNGEIEFHCYICDFMTLKRKLIGKHIKTHSKTRTKKLRKRYYCKKCVFVSETYAEFKIHEQSHERKAEMVYRNLNYLCDKCSYKTYRHDSLLCHKLIHLKPEESQYFHCYHCSYKSKRKDILRCHISRHYKKEEIKFHCYICNFMTQKRDLIIEHIKMHSKVQLKTRTKKHEKRYCCEKCSFASGTYAEFKIHQQSHKRKAEMNDRNKYHCVNCNYKTYTRYRLKSHNITHLKPEEIQYFYCYHCSYKFKRKDILRRHILLHFKKQQITFQCYICNFTTLRRKLIIEHIKKHSKIKSEINEGS